MCLVDLCSNSVGSICCEFVVQLVDSKSTTTRNNEVRTLTNRQLRLPTTANMYTIDIELAKSV